jgi:hypothetical protein
MVEKNEKGEEETKSVKMEQKGKEGAKRNEKKGKNDEKIMER